MSKGNLQQPERPFCSVVIAAAGESTRMGEDKLFIELAGAPVIVHTLRAFERSECVDEIVVVTRSGSIPEIARLCGVHALEKVKHIVEGGDSRTQSVLRGVRMCAEKAGLIAIHDGARPLVSVALIAAAVETAARTGAAAPAVQERDTVRQALRGVFTKTLDRESTYRIQTPQVFAADIILPALEEAAHLGLALTDDCQAVMLRGVEVALSPGSDENIKLTTPADLYAARAMLEERRWSTWD